LYCFCSAKFEREGREFERADGRHRHCHAGCLWLRSTKVRGPNVKIITIDDRFALRGPVDTAEEKRPIGEIADRIARSGNVDNQLEVKLTMSSND
jgi:hypothetical protein